MRHDDATKAQIVSADPAVSTWLSANAGSGKTRVLTERVARLLLAGTSPQNILCLTYTKAAAGEMQNRLFKTLGAWAMKPDEGLSEDLSRIGAGDGVDLAEARTLFARAIETPDGLKIQTIHSFCSALLRRFPLEAGVSPAFTEMDEGAQRHLLAEIADRLAAEDRDGVFTDFIRLVGGEDLDRLLARIASKRTVFNRTINRADMLTGLGVLGDLDEAAILARLDPDPLLFERLLPILHQGSKKDGEARDKLATVDFNAFSTADILVFEDVLLSKKNKDDDEKSFRARIDVFPTKAVREAMDPGLLEALNNLMLRTETARRERLALEAVEQSLVLQMFAAVFLPAYEEEKQRRGWLDFDDLISKATDLLSDRAAAQWVLFRLDGGIDHILVDESQDTSPAQWQIIALLSGELGAGAGTRGDVERTLFVVGDKKQSIYSFQGADAVAFDKMKAFFEEKLTAEGGLQSRELLHSFRSAPAVLEAVDGTFRERAARGLGDAVQHIAYHGGRPGRVDLWPLVERSEGEEEQPWDDPVDLPSPEAPSARLARGIAQEVAQMIEDPGATIETETGSRRLLPGDFLILVRGRTAQGDLFQTLIRALKAEDIPVAGADVVKLQAELAVKDLRALLAFLTLVEDDLSLACALRSPLFGLSEADLFKVAAGRGEGVTLWQALRASGHHAETVAVLKDLLDKTDFLRPYELLERLLVRHDGRKKILARLGAEAEDGVDVLLDLALQYEQKQTPSLTGFLAWLDAETIEIKRAMDQAGGTVRVMTVHGAKGLEAPVVILPDTMRADLPDKDRILIDGTGRPYWSMAQDRMPDALKSSADAVSRRNTEERQRLLYVAMTRAESWLIVCGFEQGNRSPHTWYGDVEAGLRHCNAGPLETPFGEGLRLESGGPAMRIETPAEAHVEDVVALPEWAAEPAPKPDRRMTPLSPSDLGGAKALPGEGVSEEEALRFGRQMHLLLEHLPLHAPTDRQDAAVKLLAFGEDAAMEGEALAMGETVSALIERPDLHWLFAEDALVEVDVTAMIPELADAVVAGVIDRLIVGEDAVTIIDFKTNRVVPESEEQVPRGVLRQMGAYLGAVRQIYPDRRIDLAVLWVANGVFMPLSHDIVMSALKETATS